MHSDTSTHTHTHTDLDIPSAISVLATYLATALTIDLNKRHRHG